MSLYTVLSTALVAEWDSRQATLFSDDAGTTPSTDGDVVAVWKSTANGSLSINAAQTTNANRPTYDADVGDGKPGVDFVPASSNFLTVAHNAALNPSAIHAFVVITLDAVPAYSGIIQKQGVSWGDGYGLTTNGTTKGVAFPGPGGFERTTRLVTTGTRYVISARAANSSPTLDNLVIGSASGGTRFLDGRIHHLLICSGLTQVQENDALHHLMTDWSTAEAVLVEYKSITSAPSLSSGGSTFFSRGILTGGRL